jgi:acetyltransferase-like isoleucine patch superfamily enzyme
MNNSIVHPGVNLGEGVNLGDYVIIGCPPRGNKAGELETLIGDHAEIRSHTVIYAGNSIGHHFQTGHRVTIRENNIIGANVSIGTGSVVEHHVTMEEGCRLHSQTFIPEFCILEAGVWIGPNVVLTNARYPAAPDTKEYLAGITLKRRAKIGANVTILPGLTIGEDALVGAGSVVTKDVAAGTVVVGNPAKQVNSINNISHYAL